MKSEIDKDWCIDAAEREDGCEVGAGKLADDLGPIVHLRLELTKTQNTLSQLRDAAENAYSELAFAVHDLAGRRLYNDSDIDRRAERLAKCADELRNVLDKEKQSDSP